MDEERKLVSELQGKLAELDQKVGQYGKDMAAEFERHKERVLRDVPKELSDTVSKAIATSMKEYRALYPALAGKNGNSESGPTTGNNHNDAAEDIQHDALPELYTRPRPIAFRPSTLQPPDDSQHSRSPHARDHEFLGILTPAFLPLLGDSRKERRESDERRASIERQRSLDQGEPSSRIETETETVDASTDTRSHTSTPDASRPPVPQRKNTDEASVASDLSESTFPRSALRRSSNSSMRASPRRVRFDFEGTEVLPTASPLPAPSMIAEGIYDFDDEPASQQVENIDEEDSSPPPKRLSSSQKLRALSRQPLDEGDTTIWTAVSAPDDGSPSVEETDPSDGVSFGVGGVNTVGLDGSRAYTGPSSLISSQLQAQDYGVPVGAESNDLPSDEDMSEFNSIKGRTPMILPASILSPINESDIDGSDSPASPIRTPRPTWKTMHTVSEEKLDIGQDIGRGLRFDDDQEELFNFDENTEQRSPPEDPQDDSSDRDTLETPSPTYQPQPYPLLSRSPALPIFRSNQAAEPSQAISSLVNSFKRNHPFSMPIVSEAMHAQAASMGPVNSFVGSVTGRSGLDESNVASYRATGGLIGVGSFTGGQSMTERMYLEDFENEQAALNAKSRN